MIVEGLAHVFGDGVTTDHITPGRYYHLRSDLPRLAKHVLEDADPEFAGRVQPGDLVVAGRNFGQGSSREHAALALRLAGVGAVVAASVARIFMRNAINVGLPVVVCDTAGIAAGQRLRVDLAAGTLVNLSSGQRLSVTPLPQVMIRLLRDGGLVEHVRLHGGLAIGESEGADSGDG